MDILTCNGAPFTGVRGAVLQQEEQARQQTIPKGFQPENERLVILIMNLPCKGCLPRKEVVLFWQNYHDTWERVISFPENVIPDVNFHYYDGSEQYCTTCPHQSPLLRVVSPEHVTGRQSEWIVVNQFVLKRFYNTQNGKVHWNFLVEAE